MKKILIFVIKSMTVKETCMVTYILVTGFMFMPLFSCTNIELHNYEDYVGPKKTSVSSESQKPNDLILSKKKFSKRESPTTGKLDISIEEAILLALDNNHEFQVERLNPQIRQTFEMQERAAFDPNLSAEYSISRESEATHERSLSRIKQTDAEVAISKLLPTGTELKLEISPDHTDAPTSGDLNSARGGISITQALLQGIGSKVNLANLRQARLDTLASQYELRGFAESLIAEVEKTCWDYILAKRRIAIFTDSLKLAEDQLWETRERINIGKLAEVELYAAKAEVALRREALINARSDFALTLLKLKRLLNQRGDNSWDLEISIADKPVVSDVEIDDVVKHVQVALRWRPDLNQTRLEIKRGDLEIIKTKNGLLPVIDLFITMGKTGYADSFSGSFRDLDGEGYDIAGGIIFEYPINKWADRARHMRATLSRQQSEEAFLNLAQLIEVDVRSAFIEINRAGEQVTATAATRKLQEESLRAETEKFRVGKSTALLVARAQRDFVASQITEIEAVITHLKALIDLYRLEGSLLERRGIAAPGREPVDLSLDNKRF